MLITYPSNSLFRFTSCFVHFQNMRNTLYVIN